MTIDNILLEAVDNNYVLDKPQAMQLANSYMDEMKRARDEWHVEPHGFSQDQLRKLKEPFPILGRSRVYEIKYEYTVLQGFEMSGLMEDSKQMVIPTDQLAPSTMMAHVFMVEKYTDRFVQHSRIYRDNELVGEIHAGDS